MIVKTPKKLQWKNVNTVTFPIQKHTTNRVRYNQKYPKPIKWRKNQKQKQAIKIIPVKIPIPTTLQNENGTKTPSKQQKHVWMDQTTKFDHYITSTELTEASVGKRTGDNYRAAGKRFYEWFDKIRSKNPNMKTIKHMLNHFEIFQLDAIIKEYLTAKFNKTRNCGGTLHNEVSGIVFCWAVDFGVSITGELLPSVNRICKGADNILLELDGPKAVGKRPILNPILEAMLKFATPKERFALLFAQRFCLRSEHYCNNKGRRKYAKDTYIRFQDLQFIPNIKNPVALAIVTKYDKNNPKLEHMERVVYCCCKNTRWTCLVHEAKSLFEHAPLAPTAAAVQCRTGDMHYSAMRTIIQKLITMIGLNKKDYGTHSARSAGTTEKFNIGKTAIWIQHFGWWNNVGSVMIYIKPNNPDLKKFWEGTIPYVEFRRQEGTHEDKHEKELQELTLAIQKQDNKRIHGNKMSKIVKRKILFDKPAQEVLDLCKIIDQQLHLPEKPIVAKKKGRKSKRIKMKRGKSSKKTRFKFKINPTDTRLRASIESNKKKKKLTTLASKAARWDRFLPKIKNFKTYVSDHTPTSRSNIPILDNSSKYCYQDYIHHDSAYVKMTDGWTRWADISSYSEGQSSCGDIESSDEPILPTITPLAPTPISVATAANIPNCAPNTLLRKAEIED